MNLRNIGIERDYTRAGDHGTNFTPDFMPDTALYSRTRSLTPVLKDRSPWQGGPWIEKFDMRPRRGAMYVAGPPGTLRRAFYFAAPLRRTRSERAVDRIGRMSAH